MTAYAVICFALAATARARNITVYAVGPPTSPTKPHWRASYSRNSCPYTVWPAVFTTPGLGASYSGPTGWEAPAGSNRTIQVPENWTSGRIWARTGCDFTISVPGAQQCETGGCNGGLLCDANTGTGLPPTSLTEWYVQRRVRYRHK